MTTLFEPVEVECGVRCDVGVAGVDGLLVGSPGCVRVPLRRPVSRSPNGGSFLLGMAGGHAAGQTGQNGPGGGHGGQGAGPGLASGTPAR